MRAIKSPIISNTTTDHPQTQCLKEEEATRLTQVKHIAAIIQYISEEYFFTLPSYSSSKNEPPIPETSFKNGLKQMAPPRMALSIFEYCVGLTQALELDISVLVVAFILIYRLMKSIKEHSIFRQPPPLNFYKVVAVSLFCAQKLSLDRDNIGIQDFATIARLSAKELGELEIEFLEDINFTLHVTREEFMKAHAGKLNFSFCLESETNVMTE